MADVNNTNQTQQNVNTDPAAATGQATQNQAQTPPTPAEQQNNTAGNSGGEITVESLMAEMADLKAQNAQLKANNDKLCTSEGNLRKQLRAKQTAEEQEAEAKAEQAQQQAEYIKGLERFKDITESSKRYLAMGMSAELAEATATAEVDGERETVTSNLTKFMQARDEAREKALREKYFAEFGNVQSGNVGQVDYSQQINKAISDGDMQSAALAILQQAEANKPTA